MAKSRYSILQKTIDEKDFTIRHQTFPNISGEDLYSPNDTFMVWDETQRLDKIADEILGDGRYWWIICLINNIDFPFGKIQNGRTIRIPTNLNYIFNILNIKVNQL